MELNSRLKSLYAAVREGKITDVRKFIVASKLSKTERCDWYFQAVIDKQKKVAELILHNGFFHEKESPEAAAADKAKAEIIEELIKKLENAENFPASFFMSLAIYEGSDKLVSLLLSKGADVHSKLKGPYTAIQLAVIKGHPKIVEVLLAKKADVNSKHEKVTLLHAATFRGSDEIVALLLKNGANVDAKRQDGTTALYTAVEKGFTQIAEKLITAGANVNAKFFSTDRIRDPFREKLIATENLTFLSVGVNPLQYPPNCKHDEKDLTLLHIAANNGNAELVDLLVKNGAEVNASNNFYTTPLYLAVVKHHESVVKLLIEHGADINFKDGDEHTIMHLIAVGGCLKSAALALKYGANINAKNWSLETPLHIAAGHNEVEIIEFLLKNGADIEARDSDKNTPLITAGGSGCANAVKVMLKFGAKFSARNMQSRTAFDAATANGHGVVAKLFLKPNSASSCVTKDLSELLLSATRRGHVAMIETLLSSGVNINTAVTTDFRPGRTALHIASEEGFYEIVEFLLDSGADTEVKDEDGVTALFLAVKESCMGRKNNSSMNSGPPVNHLAVVVSLLKFSADIYACDKFKRTPIGMAAYRHEEPAALKILLEYGSANMHIVSEVEASRLFDEVNVEMDSHTFWEPDSDETTAEVLVLHFEKMKAAGLYSGRKTVVAAKFNDKRQITAYRKKCEAEVAKMKEDKVGNTDISPYDILRSDLGQMAHLVENERLARALNCIDFRRNFPIYGGMLNSQFDKLKNKYPRLRDKAVRICHFLLNRIHPMPYDVSEMLAMKYLDRKDLKILSRWALNLKLGFDLFKHVIQDDEKA